MPFQGTPTTRAELAARMAQRDELAGQLRAITTERGTLGQQRLNAVARQEAGGGATETRLIADLDNRIRDLGERERLIERRKIAADDAIADALARGVGQEAEPQARAEQAVTYTEVSPANLSRIHGTYRFMMAAEALAFVLLGVIGWRFMVRSVERRFARTAAAPSPAMERLQTAIDSVAVEVERISENQRYVTKVLNERLPAIGAGAAQPIEVSEKERSSSRRP